MTTVNIAVEFSATPGGRYEKNGKFSGEEFRKRHLEPLFDDENDRSQVVVILDGVEGYATSFLEEAFGGLARKYGKDRCLQRLRFVSLEDELLPNELTRYIQGCDGDA